MERGYRSRWPPRRRCSRACSPGREALLSSLLSGVAGVFAAWKGGWWRTGMEVSSDLFLSLPWMFLLLTVRAALPLNLSPWTAVAFPLLLLGALGWAAPSRVVLTGARSLCDSDYLLLARAQGCRGVALLFTHLLATRS